MEYKLLNEFNIDFIQFKNIDKDLLIKIYNSVDCLVFPSIIEGFGLPILEAQKCGCPVITSNVSSMPEIAGKGAVFVDPYSTDSIKNGIELVLNDLSVRKRIIEEGLENSRRFSWTNLVKKYLSLYHSIQNKK